MQHLNEEQLARLVDEKPGEADERHLGECEECRAGVDELREQARQLAALPDLAAPVAGWQWLESRLESEAAAVTPLRRPSWTGPLLRTAAALALFLTGGVAGALVRGGATAPAIAPVVIPAPARTAEEAGSRLQSTEAAYLAALTRYSELTGAGETVDPVSRLAALEGIVLTTRAALRESPADPVINGYHLSAMGQRDAMLRQISSTDQDWY